MSKRFTDSKKWDDEWFSELEPKYKLMWLYMLDKCDHVGFFKPNIRLASFCISEKITLEEIKLVFKERIFDIEGKFFIPKFICFQYGKLNPKVKCHLSVIDALNKLNSYERVSEVLDKSYLTLKDKDKNKDNIGMNNSQKHFYLKYEEVFKTPYVPNWGKDSKLFKELSKNIEEKDLINRINNFMISTDAFILKAGYTIGVFYSQINKLTSFKKIERGDQ